MSPSSAPYHDRSEKRRSALIKRRKAFIETVIIEDHETLGRFAEWLRGRD